MNHLNTSAPQTAESPEICINGISVSRGIGIGSIYLLREERDTDLRLEIEDEHVPGELKRFDAAVESSISYLQALAIDRNNGDPVSDIFGFHSLILEDPAFVEKIRSVIETRKVNAEWAIEIVSSRYLQKQDSIHDEHFRDKYLDIADVAERLTAALDGSKDRYLFDSNTVVITREIWPSTVMALANSKPAALITEFGGWTSHSSIIARELNIPMVSGVKHLTRTFSTGGRVIVDAFRGEVILNPRSSTEESYLSYCAEHSSPSLPPGKDLEPARSLDAVEITIRANVDSPEKFKLALEQGAEGIGLYRSEILIGHGVMPSGQEQFSAYKRIVESAGELPVNIRTFDVGSGRFRKKTRAKEKNPALGLRSIRLSLTDSDSFRTQIRAILKASVGHNINILLPLISGIKEIVEAKQIVLEERLKLQERGHDIVCPPLGVMIEVPSAVLLANEIAREVDFLCLGTNDLVQYLLAVDRDNDSVAAWYQTLHPAVIRAISVVLDAAAKNNIPISVCGEMASSSYYLPILLGLGCREISINYSSLRRIRHLISRVKVSDTVRLVDLIKPLLTTEDVEKAVAAFYAAQWPDILSPDQSVRPG